MSGMRTWILVGWALSAIVTGSALYRIAYEVEQMEEELVALRDDIIETRERTHVLNAEWSYLARPGRIAELSARHLPDFQPVPADRISHIEDVPQTMPDVLDVLPPEELPEPAALRIKQ